MKNLIILGMVLMVAVGCSKRTDVPNIELIQDMMEQPAMKAQKYDETNENGLSSRVPPDNTVPIGVVPYPYEKDVLGSVKNVNPLAGDMTEEVLLDGQNYYNTNCMICHGSGGRGDGSIKAKYPLPIPALITDKVRNLTDGSIYHIITMGQGMMSPYRAQIPAKYRWQVVNYIRHLQKKTEDRK